MFRTVRLFIIRSLFTVHSAISLTAVPSWSCSKALYKRLSPIPLLSVQWINSWWWTDELSETCRVSWQNKFVKLVHLAGFNTKKNLRTIFWGVYNKSSKKICRSTIRVHVSLEHYSKVSEILSASLDRERFLWFVIGRTQVRTSDRIPSTLAQAFRRFPKSLQKHVWLIRWTSLKCFLRHPFLFNLKQWGFIK
jgi:hypothetical protein